MTKERVTKVIFQSISTVLPLWNAEIVDVLFRAKNISRYEKSFEKPTKLWKLARSNLVCPVLLLTTKSSGYLPPEVPVWMGKPGLSEWCNGNIGACHLWGPRFDSRLDPGHSCDKEGDSLRQRRFPPGAPVSSYITLQFAHMLSIRANNEHSCSRALDSIYIKKKWENLQWTPMLGPCFMPSCFSNQDTFWLVNRSQTVHKVWAGHSMIVSLWNFEALKGDVSPFWTASMLSSPVNWGNTHHWSKLRVDLIYIHLFCHQLVNLWITLFAPRRFFATVKDFWGTARVL